MATPDHLLQEDESSRIELEGSTDHLVLESSTTLDDGAGISDGDEVMVLLAPNGIACSVLMDSGTAVRVTIQSVKQIHVLTEGGTPIKVTI